MSEKDKGLHYRFQYKGLNLDPARIMLIYDANHPMQRTILKKALCAGDRGKKNIKEDIEDIINAAERWLQMIAEDEE
jgi:DNA-directed RNA polymerase subunit L|tara:strand:- start:5806 stop:6036 length:231 start_codon:yes stop_codon:yes gene_type:complete